MPPPRWWWPAGPGKRPVWPRRSSRPSYFRVYTNPDVLGVELGGALKNVIALAAGVVAGMGFGHNTLAALITRGLAEITRLGVAMGADPATFSGLAGMGDLVLTCTGSLSRNRTVGYRIGQGESLEEILEGMKSVAEGVRTVQAVRELVGDPRGGNAHQPRGPCPFVGGKGCRGGGSKSHASGAETRSMVLKLGRKRERK